MPGTASSWRGCWSRVANPLGEWERRPGQTSEAATKGLGKDQHRHGHSTCEDWACVACHRRRIAELADVPGECTVCGVVAVPDEVAVVGSTLGIVALLICAGCTAELEADS